MSSADTQPYQPHFGRLYIRDDRDQQYRARALVAALAAPTPVVRRTVTRPMFRPPYNQGATSTCTAFALATLVAAGPVINKLRVLSLKPYDLYREEVGLDEFPANNDEANAPDSGLQYGSSVRAAMQVAQRHGWLDTYAWADTVDDVIDYLVSTGPVQVGTIFLTSMFHKGNDGVAKVDRNSGVAGGHSYTFTGYNQRRGTLYTPNSWGSGGQFSLAAEDFAWLLSQRGEAAMAAERR